MLSTKSQISSSFWDPSSSFGFSAYAAPPQQNIGGDFRLYYLRILTISTSSILKSLTQFFTDCRPSLVSPNCLNHLDIFLGPSNLLKSSSIVTYKIYTHDLCSHKYLHQKTVSKNSIRRQLDQSLFSNRLICLPATEHTASSNYFALRCFNHETLFECSTQNHR